MVLCYEKSLSHLKKTKKFEFFFKKGLSNRIRFVLNNKIPHETIFSLFIAFRLLGTQICLPFQRKM